MEKESSSKDTRQERMVYRSARRILDLDECTINVIIRYLARDHAANWHILGEEDKAAQAIGVQTLDRHSGEPTMYVEYFSSTQHYRVCGRVGNIRASKGLPWAVKVNNLIVVVTAVCSKHTSIECRLVQSSKWWRIIGMPQEPYREAAGKFCKCKKGGRGDIYSLFMLVNACDQSTNCTNITTRPQIE